MDDTNGTASSQSGSWPAQTGGPAFARAGVINSPTATKAVPSVAEADLEMSFSPGLFCSTVCCNCVFAFMSKSPLIIVICFRHYQRTYTADGMRAMGYSTHNL